MKKKMFYWCALFVEIYFKRAPSLIVLNLGGLYMKIGSQA